MSEPPGTVVLVDNTVFCNFGAVGRMDLLEIALHGRGRVTEAVQEEMVRSARTVPGVRAAIDAPWLGPPVEIFDERAEVERLRRDAFGGSRRDARQHLGEAESCHVLMTDPRFDGAWWASDDRDSLDYARGNGIVTRETMDLVAEAARAGVVTPHDGVALMRSMLDAGRHPRQPVSAQELMRPRQW